jgi:quercetin dioxygenase-like cupin family protein
MWLPGKAHTVVAGEGRQVDLGNVTMRVLAVDGEPSDSFTLAEFSGGAGAWTVPHLHRSFEESFFILDGSFTFTVADEAIAATPSTYVLVPRNTAHTICAGEGGGRLLTLMVPGGLEGMFFELGALSPDAITDVTIRREISSRYDSVPVLAQS